MNGFIPRPLVFRTALVATALAAGTSITQAQSAGKAYRSVSVGAMHACGVRKDFSIYCWGNGGYGQLGNGRVVDADLGPVRVQSALRFRQVSAGATHTCALTVDGALYCWGTDVSGVLGDAALTELCQGTRCSATPVPVGGTLRFDTLTVGYEHSCALNDGIAYCWGRNEEGQLGRAPSNDLCDGVRCGRFLLPVTDRSRFTSISVRGRHSCALESRRAVCWGDNRYGQLGAPLSLASSHVPVSVPATLDFVALASGGLHSCALTRRGDVACWGRLPTDAPNEEEDAVRVLSRKTAGTRFIALGAGGTHSCALGADRAIYCWGLALYDRLGARAGDRCGDLPCSRTPVRVDREGSFSALSVGGTAACALGSKTVACWGGTAREAAVARHTDSPNEVESP